MYNIHIYIINMYIFIYLHRKLCQRRKKRGNEFQVSLIEKKYYF